MIMNATDSTVTVSYHYADLSTIEMIGMLVPGDSFRQVSQFRAEGPCLAGSLVASVGGTEVDRLDKPCQGGRWDIGRSGESSPDGSGG